jgi:hypothetical protein
VDKLRIDGDIAQGSSENIGSGKGQAVEVDAMGRAKKNDPGDPALGLFQKGVSPGSDRTRIEIAGMGNDQGLGELFPSPRTFRAGPGEKGLQLGPQGRGLSLVKTSGHGRISDPIHRPSFFDRETFRFFLKTITKG